MADGTNNMPDQTQAMLALQQYATQRSGGGKPSNFAGIPMEWNASGGLGLQAAMSLVDQPIMKKKSGKPKSGNETMKAIVEDFKKAKEGVAVIYSGDLPTGTALSSPSIGGSSGFANDIITSRMGNDGGGIAS